MPHERVGLFDFVRAGDYEAACALLSRYPPLASAVDESGMPLLHVAFGADDARMVQLILDAGADVGVEAGWGLSALQWAANMNAQDAARVLLANGASPDLWSAAALGMDEVVDGFFDNGTLRLDAGRAPSAHGADAHLRDPKFDSTPAGWAREGGHEALAARLEDLGVTR